MKKIIFFVILVLLFIGIVGSIVYIVYGKEDDIALNSEISPSVDDKIPQQLDLNESKSIWQDKFLRMKPKNYSPAAEQFSMSFNVDTSILREKSKYYQLIIDKNDAYSMFCLKQTLNSFKIKYSLTRTSEVTDNFLETDKQAIIQEIVQKLKIYDINAKFEEVWL